MRSGLGNSNFGDSLLNTLVQSGTTYHLKKVNVKSKIVAGNGIEATNKDGLLKRAKRKMLSQKMNLHLVDVAKKKDEPERVKSYWNTFHCQNKLTKADGRIYGQFCKNRFCTVCSSIRKAEIINTYLPTLQQWQEPYFVTLTVQSVKAPQLKKRINDVLRAFKIIINRNKKRNQRGKGIKLIGVKSLECNFNPLKRIYNPHLHIIVANKEIADLLVKEWCELWTKRFVFPTAQKSTKVWDKEKVLIEIVKYSTKIFTDPNMAKKGKAKTNPNIYISALDNIIGAMKDHRIFDRFGFNLPKTSKPKRNSRVLTQFSELEYDSNVFDWIEKENDEVLTGYSPPTQLINILDSHVITDIE